MVLKMLLHLKNFKLLEILTITLVFLMLPHLVYSYKNPAEVYCKALGYKSEITETVEGEVGICVFPDNASVNEWDFLLGRKALEWSYCTKNGYEAKHLENSDICKECTACVLPNGTETEVTKLMGLSFEEGKCGDDSCTVGENYGNCPKDCSSGSEDGYCDGVSDGICDPDCVALEEKVKDPDCITTTTKKTTTTIQLCNKNKKCEPSLGENYKTCPQDCPSGSKDNYCDKVSDGICDPDCTENEDSDCKKLSMLWIYIIGGIVIIVLLVLFLTRIRGGRKIESSKQIPY